MKYLMYQFYVEIKLMTALPEGFCSGEEPVVPNCLLLN
jgi:hypothetical protein